MWASNGDSGNSIRLTMDRSASVWADCHWSNDDRSWFQFKSTVLFLLLSPFHLPSYKSQQLQQCLWTFNDCGRVRDGFSRPFPNTPSSVMEQLRLDGKVAVITGEADGNGYSVAEALAEAGAHVALWYNSWVIRHMVEIAVHKLTMYFDRNDVAIESPRDLLFFTT